MVKKRAIVTGGAGFIGSNLVDKLVANNWDVVVIDNFFSGFRKNLEHHKDKITLVEGSITDKELINNTIKKGDTIWHLAAMNSVPRSIELPAETSNVNINGTLNILIAAKDKKARRVIYSGSSSAYGDMDVEIKSENLIGSPISPYGLSKFTGEEFCRIFSDIYGLSTISLRYFNVFGARQNPNSPYSAVIPLFINAMLDKKPIKIFGDGDQSRDFTYISNVVEANYLAGTVDDVATGTYNSACGDSISVNQVYKKIEKLTNYKFTINKLPPRIGDVRTSRASIEKIRNGLGYEPLVRFDEGLNETINWYKNNSTYFKNIT